MTHKHVHQFILHCPISITSTASLLHVFENKPLKFWHNDDVTVEEELGVHHGQ